MEFFVKSALTIGLPPAILTFALLSLALWISRKGKGEISRWVAGLAFVFGYALGHRIVTGSLPLVPHSSEQWLPSLAFISLLLSPIDEFKTSVWAKVAWRILLGIGVVGALLLPATFLPLPAKAAWILTLGIFLAVVCFCLDALAEREPKAWLPFTLSAVSAMSSISFLIAHSAIISQLAGVLTSVLGAAFLFVAWQRNWSLAKGATAVFVVLIFGLGINSAFYADLPVASAILLWLAPLVGWIKFAPLVMRLPNWVQTLVSICAVLLVAALGIGFTVYKLGLPESGY